MTEGTRPTFLLFSDSGAGDGAPEQFDADVVRLGRDETCEVPIRDDAASRVHATIRWDGNVFVLRDEGSLNGTLLNGALLRKPTRLSSGDRISIGKRGLYRFELPAATVSGTTAQAGAGAGGALLDQVRRRSALVGAVLGVNLLVIGAAVYLSLSNDKHDALGTRRQAEKVAADTRRYLEVLAYPMPAAGDCSTESVLVDEGRRIEAASREDRSAHFLALMRYRTALARCGASSVQAATGSMGGRPSAVAAVNALEEIEKEIARALFEAWAARAQQQPALAHARYEEVLAIVPDPNAPSHATAMTHLRSLKVSRKP